MYARNGDHLIIPYECPLCVFRILRGHSPSSFSVADKLLLDCIQRAVLDAFWSWSTSTVKGYACQTRKLLQFTEMVGLTGPFKHTALMPWRDHAGYEVAVAMLLYSRRKGKHASDHMQFDTVRSFRTVYGNFVRASPQAVSSHAALGDNSGRYLRFNHNECGSLWFSRFIEGMKNRMGQIWIPNRDFSTELLLEILKASEEKILLANNNWKEKHRWVVFNSYATLVYVVSLRVPEGLLIDLNGLNENWPPRNNRHLTIALLGRVKGETFDRAHLLPCVHRTSSGIDVRSTIERLLEVKNKMGHKDGPAISDEHGKMFNVRDLDDMLHDVLVDLFDLKRNLFPEDIKTVEEIRKFYQCFRSFRRASDTRALEVKVSTPDIDIVNRWRKVEAAEGRRPGFDMKQHYAQFDLLLKPFLRYTSAM